MSKNSKAIHQLKKELGMLRPDYGYANLPPIRPLISRSLPRKIIAKLRREFIKKRAFSRLNISGPSIPTRIASRSIAGKLTFTKHRRPDVSIIIPVFNKFELTIGCLQSLKENLPTDTKIEIIIVDNASSDDSGYYLSKIPGLHYHKNKKNEGFVDGCNIGANTASGEFLIFLNNDTSITQGWLEGLLSTIEGSKKIGIVGSKLIFPNGHLQEAGGIIYSDGTGSNYGKHDHPSDYKYNYTREVDYCSGASIIIRKNIFDTLKGFDKLYSPAYYEDTDLAFSVRKKGLKVIYQPKSVIFHIEGATAGTSTLSGFKRFQEINHKKFSKKWKDELKNQYGPGHIYKARDRSNSKLALIVDENVPKPNEDAGSVRMFRVIQALKKLGFKVTFFPNYTGYTGHHVTVLQQMGVEVIYGPVKFSNFIKSYGENYNLVILSRPRIASFYTDLCRIYCTSAQIIYDTVDLHFLRFSRQVQYESGKSKKHFQDYAEKYEILEKSLMIEADNTFVVSTTEKEILEKAGIPNVSILSTIHEIVEDSYKIGFKDRRDLLFVGGYAHHPNVDAIKWFVTDILPIIINELPDVKIHIVGSHMPEKLKEFLKDKPGVILDGFVKDLTPILQNTRVFVAPLRFGAGVKGKIGQAVEHGIPLVSTEIGIEGMGLVNGESCVVVKDKETFAKAVIKLYQDKKLWEKIRDNAKSKLTELFSLDKAIQDIKQIIR